MAERVPVASLAKLWWRRRQPRGAFGSFIEPRPARRSSPRLVAVGSEFNLVGTFFHLCLSPSRVVPCPCCRFSSDHVVFLSYVEQLYSE